MAILLSVPVRATLTWSERMTASLAWAVSLLLVIGRLLKAPLSALFERGVSPSALMFGLWLVLGALSYLVLRWQASSGENV